MADRFYGVPRGGQLAVNVTEGAASGGAAAPFEFRISDTDYADKKGALIALEAIKQYILTRETTPIA